MAARPAATASASPENRAIPARRLAARIDRCSNCGYTRNTATAAGKAQQFLQYRRHRPVPRTQNVSRRLSVNGNASVASHRNAPTTADQPREHGTSPTHVGQVCCSFVSRKCRLSLVLPRQSTLLSSGRDSARDCPALAANAMKRIRRTLRSTSFSVQVPEQVDPHRAPCRAADPVAEKPFGYFALCSNDSAKQPRGTGCPCAHSTRRELIRQGWQPSPTRTRRAFPGGTRAGIIGAAQEVLRRSGPAATGYRGAVARERRKHLQGSNHEASCFFLTAAPAVVENPPGVGSCRAGSRRRVGWAAAGICGKRGLCSFPGTGSFFCDADATSSRGRSGGSRSDGAGGRFHKYTAIRSGIDTKVDERCCRSAAVCCCHSSTASGAPRNRNIACSVSTTVGRDRVGRILGRTGCAGGVAHDSAACSVEQRNRSACPWRFQRRACHDWCRHSTGHPCAADGLHRDEFARCFRTCTGKSLSQCEARRAGQFIGGHCHRHH